MTRRIPRRPCSCVFGGSRLDRTEITCCGTRVELQSSGWGLGGGREENGGLLSGDGFHEPVSVSMLMNNAKAKALPDPGGGEGDRHRIRLLWLAILQNAG